MGTAASLDTNCIVHCFVEDVTAQTIAIHKLLADGNTYGIADVALIEAVFVLEKQYQFSRSLVVEFIGTIVNMRQVNCNRPLFRTALKLYEANKSESIIDCCLAVYANLTDATPLLTFDKSAAKHLPDTKLLAV